MYFFLSYIKNIILYEFIKIILYVSFYVHINKGNIDLIEELVYITPNNLVLIKEALH
jgi:hypothetical protein